MADVVVLAGGPSSEHAVSLESSAAFLTSLREAGHAARPLLISHALTWHLGAAGSSFDDLPGDAPGQTTEEALAALAAAGTVAVLGLHGPFGEDGEIQRLLAAAGVPYTGSGPVASQNGFDKQVAKVAATKIGARCAKHEVLEGTRLPAWGISQSLGYPCFVKPLRAGSSVGVTKVTSEEQLEAASARARAEDAQDACLVEEFIDGTEVTCTVLRMDGEITTLPLVSIEAAGDFYDYHAKYESEQTQLRCPAPIPEMSRAEIERISRALYEGLELRGIARVDFIVPAGDERPCFLEVNTLPGFTAHSLVPLSARVAGLPATALVEALLADLNRP